MAKTVLVVDDDPMQRRLMQASIEKQGFAVRLAESGEQGLDEASDPRKGVDLVLLDLVMPGLSGMDTLAQLAQRRPDLPVVVVTATGGIDTVVQAMRGGAVDFFVKPASPERLGVSIRNALRMTQLSGEVKRLTKTQANTLGFDDLIAQAPIMRQVVRLGQRAAGSNIPILILGESGVGKELVARAIQGASERSGRPFVTVNCGAIPENLVESILFGHEKGSFTGATDKHLGKFMEANGGTLFLDEVGELPLDMQVKLLRALQEGEIDPIGAKRAHKVDVRIISATNRDLATQVREGRFREDLFYRLNVFPIDMPSLRERREDISLLVDHFIGRFNAQEGKRISGVSAETLRLLQAHDWPGNVRQLENAVFRAVILCDGVQLQPEDFPQISGLTPKLAEVETAAATSLEPGALGVDEEAFVSPVRLFDPSGNLRTLEEIERDLIQHAIDVYSGHMSEVARRLGIGRSTLYRKVREHDIKVREEA
jgi:DNA-binding NtrC family response regulator